MKNESKYCKTVWISCQFFSKNIKLWFRYLCSMLKWAEWNKNLDVHGLPISDFYGHFHVFFNIFWLNALTGSVNKYGSSCTPCCVVWTRYRLIVTLQTIFTDVVGRVEGNRDENHFKAAPPPCYRQSKHLFIHHGVLRERHFVISIEIAPSRLRYRYLPVRWVTILQENPA